MGLFTETVTLRFTGGPTGEYDNLGNEIIGPPRDEPWPSWYEVRGSSEAENARDQQVYGYWLYLPEDAPLSAADTVVIAGAEYQVVGEPGRQPGGFILDGYVKAALERVTG